MLIIHSGTAAFDLGVDLAMPEASAPWKPSPIPDVSELAHTSKGWILKNGIHRPPPNRGAWNAAIVGSTFPTNPYSTATTFIPSLSNYSAPPNPMPVEKREMPIVGYRSWKFQQVYKLGWGKKGALLPLNQGYGPWTAQANTAYCRIGQAHRAADEHCTCGFHVLTSLDQAETWVTMADDVIVGAVMGWGKVVQHGAEGWRAEHAKVIALLDCKFSKGQSENTKVIAKSYNLEVKERSQLEAMVSEWGDPFADA